MKLKSKHTLTPKLRFPEFRDGEGWQTPQLSDLYGFKRTNTLSRDKLNYEAGTIRNIHYGDIHTKFKPLFRISHECVPFINREVPIDAFEEENDCEEGDIVLADASEDLNDVGKAIEIVSLDGQRVVAGTHTILATRHGSLPIVGFGGHLFQSAAVRSGIQRESQGAKVYGISANRISPVALPLPPTNQEQQKIAECLSSLDRLITAAGCALEALRDHKRGLMQQLFPQPGQTQPRLRFPEFRDKGEWKSTTVGESVKTITPPKRLLTSEYREDGRFPIVDQSPAPVCGRTDDVDAILSKGFPFTIFGDHTCVVKFVDQPFAQGADGIKILKASSMIDDLFLYFSLQARPLSSTQYKRHFTTLQEQEIVYPDVETGEQQQITACLTALDTRIVAQAAKIETLKTHKRGLMQQLFPAPQEVEA